MILERMGTFTKPVAVMAMAIAPETRRKRENRIAAMIKIIFKQLLPAPCLPAGKFFFSSGGFTGGFSSPGEGILFEFQWNGDQVCDRFSLFGQFCHRRLQRR